MIAVLQELLTVVGHHDEERLVRDSELFQPFHQPRDLDVHGSCSYGSIVPVVLVLDVQLLVDIRRVHLDLRRKIVHHTLPKLIAPLVFLLTFCRAPKRVVWCIRLEGTVGIEHMDEREERDVVVVAGEFE